MSTNDEKISQIQIGGLQPSDDLTWIDPFVWYSASHIKSNITDLSNRIFHTFSKPSML